MIRIDTEHKINTAAIVNNSTTVFGDSSVQDEYSYEDKTLEKFESQFTEKYGCELQDIVDMLKKMHPEVFI